MYTCMHTYITTHTIHHTIVLNKYVYININIYIYIYIYNIFTIIISKLTIYTFYILYTLYKSYISVLLNIVYVFVPNTNI